MHGCQGCLQAHKARGYRGQGVSEVGSWPCCRVSHFPSVSSVSHWEKGLITTGVFVAFNSRAARKQQGGDGDCWASSAFICQRSAEES